MAFTLAEMTSIRDYLGWTARFTQFDSALERAFAFVGSLSSGGDPSIENQIRTLLVKVQGIEANIDTAMQRFAADAVGTIKLNRREIQQYADRGQAYIGRIARLLGVDAKGYAFKADMPKFTAGPWGAASGGGNPQRQG